MSVLSVISTEINDEEDMIKKQLRLDRFKDHLHIPIESIEHNYSNINGIPSPKRLKGTNLNIEKSYLRLTSAPNPSTVRNIHTLKLSLQYVKEKYINNADYAYTCEQLKSIRQDLTIQNINTRFTAHVYETHARIALECGDLPEYNQCQSRLQELNAKGVPISTDEFTCYALLHALIQSNHIEVIHLLRSASTIHTSTNSIHTSMTNNVLDFPATHFALQVINAVRCHNYSNFFRLYQKSPHLSAYILDYMLAPMRDRAFDRILKSFANVPVLYIQKELHFTDTKEMKRFLKRKSAILVNSTENDTTSVICIDTKETLRITTNALLPSPIVSIKKDSNNNNDNSKGTKSAIMSITCMNNKSMKKSMNGKEEKKQLKKLLKIQKKASKREEKVNIGTNTHLYGKKHKRSEEEVGAGGLTEVLRNGLSASRGVSVSHTAGSAGKKIRLN